MRIFILFSIFFSFIAQAAIMDVGRGVYAGKTGNVYTVGYELRDNISNWVVRKSIDNGYTWKVIDNYGCPDCNARPDGIVEDSKGNIFVSGHVFIKGDTYWLIRMSRDGGRTWTESEKEEVGSEGRLIKESPDGNLFAIGDTKIDGAIYWIVKKSTDNGDSWMIVDKYREEKEYAVPQGLVIAENGDVFVSGNIGDLYSDQWIIRKSSDGGKTWKVVDRGGNGTSWAMALSQDGILVLIKEETDTLVKKSYDGGITWEKIGQFPLNVMESVALDIAEAANGFVYIVGAASLPQLSDDYWLVHRLYSDHNYSTYIYFDESPSCAHSISVAPSGTLFATGRAGDSWVMHKSTDNGRTWMKTNFTRSSLTK